MAKRISIVLVAAFLAFGLSMLFAGCEGGEFVSTGAGGGGGGGGGGTGGGGGSVNRPPSNNGSICDLFDRINSMRSTPLSWDDGIAEVAQNYADWLTDKEKQYSQNADGKSPSQRLTEGGVAFNICDETGTSDPATMPEQGYTAHVTQYLDTSTLTDSRFTRIGMGYNGWGFTG